MLFQTKNEKGRYLSRLPGRDSRVAFKTVRLFLTHTGPIFRSFLYSATSDLCKASGIPSLPDTAKISVVFSGKCVIIYKIKSIKNAREDPGISV